MCRKLSTQYRIVQILAFVVVLIFGLKLRAKDADAPSPMEEYQHGIQSYQNNQLSEAQNLFLQALQSSPENKFILYNLGLTDFQLGKKGRAIGAWRRALYLDPYFISARKALKYAMSKMGDLSSGTTSNWETFRQSVLQRVSLNQLLLLTAILLLSAGFVLIRYWSLRRQALANESPLPDIPYLGIGLGCLLLISAGMTLGKAYDYFVPRATIINERVAVHSGPSAEDASLFEILEGHEVIIRKVIKDWAQITYPGGLTGWVPRDSLFYSSGKPPW